MENMDVTKINSLGELIKFHRESKNISIKDLSAKTKIRRTQLESLEENNFHELPSRVYLLGYLKTLSRELKMDFNGALKFLEEINLKEEALVFLPLGKKIEPAEFKFNEKSSSNKVMLMALILCFGLALAFIIFIKYNDQILSALTK